MQFACLTQIVVRFAFHQQTAEAAPTPLALFSLAKFIFLQLCGLRKKLQSCRSRRSWTSWSLRQAHPVGRITMERYFHFPHCLAPAALHIFPALTTALREIKYIVMMKFSKFQFFTSPRLEGFLTFPNKIIPL